MYDPPAYVWALTIGGPTAIAAATCIALYGGAVRTAWAEGAALRAGAGAARRPPILGHRQPMTPLPFERTAP